MLDNPYGSPSSGKLPPAVDSGRGTADRPVGISILAVLYLIGGAILFSVQIFLFANLQALDESLQFVGASPILLIIGVMFLAILAIASGIGMWMGTKWGWWLAAFSCIYSAFRNGSALLTTVAMADQLEVITQREPEYYIVKYGGRVLIQLLLFMYFFKDSVLEYFKMDKLNNLRAVAMLVGTCMTLVATTSAISLLLR